MKRLFQAFVFAGSGARHCFRQEANFKLHLMAAALAVLLGIFFKISGMEWIIIVTCITAVVGFEMLNTAIEHLCNMIQKEIHPSVKIIKDVAAGAVLVVAAGAGVCGAIIFIPKIILFIQSM
jgi:diacylglycerol kinase